MQKEETKIINELSQTIERLEHTLASISHSTDKVVEPYRKSAARRYPVLFLVLVTFGATATLYGFERIIAHITFFDKYPVLILLTGLIVLVATGTLYKKLN